MGRPIAHSPSRSLKVPVVICDAYTIRFERSGSMTFIHCDVYAPWTKSVKSELMADFAALKRLHRETIYALHDAGDLKHLKFLRMFGFVPHRVIPGCDEQIYKTQ